MLSGSFATPTDLIGRVREVDRVRREADLELLRGLREQSEALEEATA